MKLSEFILLNEDEKRVVVLHVGVLVAKRTSDGCCVFLFQLGSFYVEVFCNLADKAVQEYRAYTEVDQLTPYLDSIELDGLL
jgi:hypothetical protein